MPMMPNAATPERVVSMRRMGETLSLPPQLRIEDRGLRIGIERIADCGLKMDRSAIRSPQSRNSDPQSPILNSLVYLPIASSSLSVRQYHMPPTRAGEAITRAWSSFTRLSLNVGPASTTNVWPSSFVK